MEKTNKRVSKRYIVASTIAILLAVLTTSGSAGDGEIVKSEPIKHNVVDIQKKVQALPKTTKVEPKVVEVKKKVEPIEKWLDFKMTHYVANCKGCTGITKAEINVKNRTTYQGYKILSVDTRIIPLGSIVEIKDGKTVFQAIAIDTGGAIKGRKLDLLVGSVKEARNEGRKDVKLRVVREGWGESGK